MAKLPMPLLLLLVSFTTHATALHAIPSPLLTAEDARITQAPSPAVVDLRLRSLDRRATPSLNINSCATKCFNSVLTKSTTCTIGDYYCECKESNQLILSLGAISCVYSACTNVAVAADVFSVVADFCTSINNGEFDSPTAGPLKTTDATVEELGTSVVTELVTRTGIDGSVFTVTSVSVVLIPTGSSSSGGSSNSNDNSSPSATHGPSTGTIVGIAIGAAGGAIIFCAILFLVWKYCLKKPHQPYDPVANPSGRGDALAAYPTQGGRAEIGGTTVHTVTPSPGPMRDNLTKYHPPSVMVASPPPRPVSPMDAQQSPSPVPPVYQELHGQHWTQQRQEIDGREWQGQQQHTNLGQQAHMAQPGQVVYQHGAELDGNRHGHGLGGTYQEMEQPRPEMMGNVRYPQEVGGNVYPGQEMGGGQRWNVPQAYEMSSTPRPGFVAPQ